MSRSRRPAHPLRLELQRRGFTSADFAPTVGVTVSSLDAVIKGAAYPWAALRRRCSEALGLPEHELFPGIPTAESVAAERVAQGLEPSISDRAVLNILAAVIRAGGGADGTAA